MKVWLDDERPCPHDYNLHIKTADEAIELLKTGKVIKISLDHDLGTDDLNNTGYKVAKFIEEGAFKKELKYIEVNIHTANPIGRKNMLTAIRNAKFYWKDNG